MREFGDFFCFEKGFQDKRCVVRDGNRVGNRDVPYFILYFIPVTSLIRETR